MHYLKFSIERYPDKSYTIIRRCIKCGMEEHKHSGNATEEPFSYFVKKGKFIDRLF